MRYHRSLLPALAVLGLVVPATASAKQITKAEVCGPADCAVVADDRALRAFMDLGPPVPAPKVRAPLYEVRVTISAGESSDTWTLVYVPSAQRLGTGVTRSDDWFDARSPAGVVLARATKALEPFPDAKLRSVPAASRAATVDASSGFPWAVPAVLVGMLGVLGMGWAGKQRTKST